MKTRVFLLFALLIVLAANRGTTVEAEFAAQSTALDDLKIAFVSNRDGDEDIYLMWLDTSRSPVNLMPDQDGTREWNPTWSPDGAKIAFNSDRDGTARIYTINQNRTGLRQLIQDGLAVNDLAPAWSPDGSRVAFVSDRSGVGYDLYSVDANGENLLRLTNYQTIVGDPAWSPDGLWLSFWQIEQNGEIYIYKLNLSSNEFQRMTTVGPHSGMPVWSPDGVKVYFDSDRDGAWKVWSMNADGSNAQPLITDIVGFSGRASVSPDSAKILFVTNQEQSDEIYVMNVDQTGMRRLTENTASDHSPVWQPAIPQETIYVELPDAPQVTPTIAPTPASVSDVAVGQSAEASVEGALTIDTTLLNYGIQQWQQAGWTGAGRKIAVLDLGFTGLTDFQQSSGANVIVPTRDTIEAYSASSETDHGTRVLQIIHAIAPGAELYACRYDASFEGFRACAGWATDVQVNIINHSVGIPALPLNGENEWAQIAEDTFERNILWVNSAGNFKRGVLLQNYADLDGDGSFDFSRGTNSDNLLRMPIDAPYQGNIILTWSPVKIYNSQGIEEQVDLDLEVIDLSSGSVIRSSFRNQRSDVNLSTSEYVLVNTNAPFGIRILNQGQTFDAVVEVALFVEYLAIEGASLEGSVIAPGDAPHSLTVGAVQNATQQLAVYSSFGVAGSTMRKPDLTAPGEFIMPDGVTFIGTSAAAPFVAGAAALIWQENPALFTDALYDELLNLFVEQQPNSDYGAGILTLPSPPSENMSVTGNTDVEIDPFTVFPEAPVQATPPPVVCSGVQPIRLAPGASGYVNFNLGLAMRSQPTSTSQNLINLYLGDEFKVIDGPVCQSGNNWWQVQLVDGSIGWLAEGGDYYFIAPSNLERALVPLQPEACPAAPPTQLEVGGRAQVISTPAGGLTLWRTSDARFTIGALSEGDIVHLLGGPLCRGQDTNVVRWAVRVLSGEWEGNEAYISEATTGERWLGPYNGDGEIQ